MGAANTVRPHHPCSLPGVELFFACRKMLVHRSHKGPHFAMYRIRPPSAIRKHRGGPEAQDALHRRDAQDDDRRQQQKPFVCYLLPCLPACRADHTTRPYQYPFTFLPRVQKQRLITAKQFFLTCSSSSKFRFCHPRILSEPAK